MEYRLTDIFSIQDLQDLFDSISKLNGIALALLDIEGNVAVASGFTEICTKFHKRNQISCAGCEYSDTVLSLPDENENYKIYNCKNGMVDVSMPVKVEDRMIGSLFTGQLFLKEPDIEFFIKQAATHGFEEEIYLDAVRKVPIVGESELQSRIDFLLQLKNILTDMGYKNLQATRHTMQMKESKEHAEELIKRFEYATSIGKVGTWDWNLITDELLWSEETFRILGHKPFSITPSYQLFLDIVHPEDREHLDNSVKATWNERKPYSVDCRIKISNNEERYCNATGKVEYNSKGEPTRMIGTFQDITRLKKAEVELKEQNEEYLSLYEEFKVQNEELHIAKTKAEAANTLKTEFLNNMSHEIRTPMNGIMGFSEMLNFPDISDDKRKYYSKIVHNSCEQLLRTIDDILDISTLETKQVKLDKSKFQLNDLLMELFSIFSLKSKERGYPIYLNKTLSDEQSYIETDKSKLHKILSNLLENAIKFTSEGYVELGYQQVSNNIEIYVKDTGIGISEHAKETIFERFAQEEKELSSKFGGLGLGLSISKENAQLLGGDIKVESEKGKGATFYVILPFHSADKQNTFTNKPERNGSRSQKDNEFTVLVAEDEEVNYLYIEALLKQESKGSISLLHAKNGKEAVELCATNHHIDLILMDIKMPVMNGYDATLKIRNNNTKVPIVAQTAYSTESDKKTALSSGCNDFISKPLKKEELLLLINKYLHR